MGDQNCRLNSTKYWGDHVASDNEWLLYLLNVCVLSPYPSTRWNIYLRQRSGRPNITSGKCIKKKRICSPAKCDRTTYVEHKVSKWSETPPGRGNRYQDWRGCSARTTWPWPWENIKYDPKAWDCIPWGNTDKNNWQKRIPWENTCPQKVHPDGRHIPVPPTYESPPPPPHPPPGII